MWEGLRFEGLGGLGMGVIRGLGMGGFGLTKVHPRLRPLVRGFLLMFSPSSGLIDNIW